ncbi:MAG: ABC transporter ATP-binding protein, partial [Oscillospiraceae bacterium]
MLKVDNINVYYGQIHALYDVSFEVKPGEIVTLIGANGAGKSTVLKTISGLLRSKTGDVLFEDQSVSKTMSHIIVQKGLAHVPEGRRIFLNMTVKENLEMGGFTQKIVTKDDLQAVYEKFPRLHERRKQIAGTLSGGEQQMLAMGRALMIKPKLIMLDEP